MAGGENRLYPKRKNGEPVALEARGEDGDRRFSPSVARNRDVLRDAFLAHMPSAGRILEIGSGTGEHGIHITKAAPDLFWTFTDLDPLSQASIAAWISFTASNRHSGPMALDAAASDWNGLEAGPGFDGVVSINVIHIAPDSVMQGIIAGAARVLRPGGKMFFYGPFGRHGVMADSNRAFDADLKRRSPAWGVRDLELDLVPLAEAAGLMLGEVIEMPSNNLSVIFKRR